MLRHNDSVPYRGARDLDGLPTDDEQQPSNAGIPTTGATAASGGVGVGGGGGTATIASTGANIPRHSRGSSPSPIRGKGPESPARSPVYVDAVPRDRVPHQDLFHLLHQAPPPVDPAPPPRPQPQPPETILKVEVPDLRKETADAGKSTATTSPSHSPHSRSKKLVFHEESAPTNTTLLPAHKESESGMLSRRVDSSRLTTTNSEGNIQRPGAVDATRPLLRDGKLRVRVTRDGKSSVEEMDPNELAHLYAQQQAALQQMRSQFDFLTVPDWVRLHPMLGPYLAEVTGTFAWVLTLALTSIRNESIFNKTDDTNVTCVPIGFMFTSMVFTFGYISGGHFNPAISLAVFLIRKMDLVRCLGYIICQIAAAFVAGVVAMLIQGGTKIFVPSVENSFVSSGIFAELIYTFAVALVVLNIGYSRQSGNFFYGFAIGMTMAAGSASVGHISGGTFNPAAATGLQLAVCMTGDCDDLKSFWIYWLAPLVGAVVAALLYSQMYQPVNTQVLEDHKVLRDPTKAFMKQPGDGSEADENEANRSEDGHRESDSNGPDSADARSSAASSFARRDGNRGNGDDGGEEEMTDMHRGGRVGGSSATVLNDSLTEPVVVRYGARGGDKNTDISSLV